MERTMEDKVEGTAEVKVSAITNYNFQLTFFVGTFFVLHETEKKREATK